MVKIYVLYGPPTDPEAFDAYYFSTHVPLFAKIPGLRSYSVSKFPSLDGAPVTTHLMTEMSFDSLEDLGAGMASAEGQAAAADVPNFATGTVTVLTGEVVQAS
jgi:uncharacterized protein (TIGR02118 family)